MRELGPLRFLGCMNENAPSVEPSPMTPELLDINRFLIAVQHCLPIFGRDCLVRLVREGDSLVGARVLEAGVAFFDSRGGLFHWMPIDPFEREFAAQLAAHRQGNPHDAGATSTTASGSWTLPPTAPR